MAGTVANSMSHTQLRPVSCSNRHPHHFPFRKAHTVNLGSVTGTRFSLHRGAFIPFNTSARPGSSPLCLGCEASASSKVVAENSNDHNNESCSNWDWNRWNRYFSEIEKAENSVSFLKFQLEDAIKKEDFEEATKLKMAIEEATSKHSVAEIMSQFKIALQEERFHDASRLSNQTGSGLVGWWVGYSKDPYDPFGRFVHITPSIGRFVGRSYSPSQLVTATLGTPIFEIYVFKDTDGTYHMQVVYLEQVKGNSANTIQAKTPDKSENENGSSIEEAEGNKDKMEANGQKAVTIGEAAIDIIKTGIGFLVEWIAGLKVTNPKGDNDAFEDVNEYYRRLCSSGLVLQNTEDITTNDEIVRFPAGIQDIDKSCFILHIPERNADPSAFKLSEEFWSSSDVSEMSQVREIMKLTNRQEQRWSILSEATFFSRITTAPVDPFDGLYVGTYGPYGTGVVQLKRRYGQWNSDTEEKPADVEFFEYVEAVKLTGDLNIPAGEVTFRAKIGKRILKSKSGRDSNDLGVAAIYEGQGRMAEFGFQNAQWVYGELLHLDGKVIEPYPKGADLCFLFFASDEIQQVMFFRLKLPE